MSNMENGKITAIGYDEPSQTLELLFENRKVYQFYNVSQTIADALQASHNPTDFYNSQIVGAFPYALTENNG